MPGIQVKVQSATLLYDKKHLRATLRTAGAEVAAAARALIRASAGAGAAYRGANRGRSASAPGAPPRSLSGALARSIRVKPILGGDGVSVRDTQFYALFLEAGAKGGGRLRRGGVPIRGKAGIGTARVLLPRPFLSAALAARAPTLLPRVQRSLREDIKLVRSRP